MQWLGVAQPELEDVPDLDRRLDPDRGAVHGVTVDDGPHVDRVVAEIAARLDPLQVQVGLVRPGHVWAGRDPAIEQDRQIRPHGPDEAWRTEPLLDLVRMRGPEVAPKCQAE